ncbi:MAG: 6-phosphogluconolactonase [Acidobacteriota bacterium]|nr:6-phosphogluconolactonase [Acidobacteriota bacterium]
MHLIKIVQNPDELSITAAELFIEIANDAIEKSGRFTVALSGGSTPKAMYRKLVSSNLDWKRVFFFFGDERNVPPGDERSNFLMAENVLFKPLKLCEENIYRWQTEFGVPEKITTDYSKTIQSFFQGFPRFDLMLLGLGTDGHTASLFPDTDALNEQSEIAVANWVKSMNEYRFTLTFPVINNASNVVFLVSGKEKAAILKNVIDDRIFPELLPAQLVNPKDGNLFWLIDKPAAAFLRAV